MTPKEIAIDLIKTYVLRGDDANELRKSHIGAYTDKYGAMVGGYSNGKYYSDKIVVERIKDVEYCHLFNFYEIYNEIKQGAIQLKLL